MSGPLALPREPQFLVEEEMVAKLGSGAMPLGAPGLCLGRPTPQLQAGLSH